jgi:hypothetical protein
MITGGDGKVRLPPQFGFAFQICTDVFSVRLICWLCGITTNNRGQGYTHCTIRNLKDYRLIPPCIMCSPEPECLGGSFNIYRDKNDDSSTPWDRSIPFRYPSYIVRWSALKSLRSRPVFPLPVCNSDKSPRGLLLREFLDQSEPVSGCTADIEWHTIIWPSRYQTFFPPLR